MELLKHINSLKYKNQIDLLPNIYVDGFAYTPPHRERMPMYIMGSPDPRSFSRGNKKRVFVGSIYPIYGDLLSTIKEDKFRVITMNKSYIVQSMDVLNDNEDARCYTFTAKYILEEKVL